jgi:hypothetical protein
MAVRLAAMGVIVVRRLAFGVLCLMPRAKGRGALNAKRSGSRRRFLRLRLRLRKSDDQTSMPPEFALAS